jgi:CBS domain-containing protein
MYTVKHMLDDKGHQVWTVSPETMIIAALELMKEKSVGALVVIYQERIVGIFSERDYARKVVLHGKSSLETPVKEVMTFRVYSVGLDTPAEECMALMSQKRVRHLPVLDEGKLIGLVSIGDVVKSIISEHSSTIEHLQNYIRGKH